MDGILDSINKTKLQNCVSKNLDFELLVFYFGFSGIVLLAIATAFFSKLTFKKPRSGSR